MTHDIGSVWHFADSLGSVVVSIGPVATESADIRFGS